MGGGPTKGGDLRQLIDGLDSAGRTGYQGFMAPRKRTPAKKATSSKPRGMRITHKDRRSLAELRAVLLDAVDRLDALGITHVFSTNLYVTPCDKNGNLVFPRKDGYPISTIDIEAPYKSFADEKKS